MEGQLFLTHELVTVNKSINYYDYYVVCLADGKLDAKNNK